MYACMRACNMYVDVRGFELLSVTGLERLNYSNSSHRNLKLDLLSTLSSISQPVMKKCVCEGDGHRKLRGPQTRIWRGWVVVGGCLLLLIFSCNLWNHAYFPVSAAIICASGCLFCLEPAPKQCTGPVASFCYLVVLNVCTYVCIPFVLFVSWLLWLWMCM